MDVVYFVRKGDANDELRYSLRSLKNLPHDNVFIAGYKPKWCKNINHIPVDQTESKTLNVRKNIQAALNCSDVSNDFIYMNDDFYIMQPIEKLPLLTRGTIEDVIAKFKAKNIRSRYLETMEAMRDYLIELKTPTRNSYELHIPMEINRHKMLEMYVMQRSQKNEFRRGHTRTLYGNFFNIGGTPTEDVKIYDSAREIPKEPIFLSSRDSAFMGRFRAKMRDQFKQYCQYEHHHMM